MNVLKNVLIGIAWIIGAVLGIAVLAMLGVGLWMVLGTVGVIFVGATRILFWFILLAVLCIAVAYAIGYVFTSVLK